MAKKKEETNKPLSDRDKTLARLIGQGMSKGAAGVEVGFEENSASVSVSRLLKNAKLSKLVETERKKYLDRLADKDLFSREAQLRKLERVVLKSSQLEAVQEFDATTGEKGPTGEYKYDGNAVIRAVNEQNKMLGHHTPVKVEATVSIQDIIKQARGEEE